MRPGQRTTRGFAGCLYQRGGCRGLWRTCLEYVGVCQGNNTIRTMYWFLLMPMCSNDAHKSVPINHHHSYNNYRHSTGALTVRTDGPSQLLSANPVIVSGNCSFTSNGPSTLVLWSNANVCGATTAKVGAEGLLYFFHQVFFCCCMGV